MWGGGGRYHKQITLIITGLPIIKSNTPRLATTLGLPFSHSIQQTNLIFITCDSGCIGLVERDLFQGVDFIVGS